MKHIHIFENFSNESSDVKVDLSKLTDDLLLQLIDIIMNKGNIEDPNHQKFMMELAKEKSKRKI